MRVPDTSPPFDTQSAVEHLQAGGLSNAQAVAITRTLVDATANLATKADLAAVESQLQAGIDDLKGAVDDLLKGAVDDLKGSDKESRDSIGGLREAIGEVRAEIARSQAVTVRMMPPCVVRHHRGGRGTPPDSVPIDVDATARPRHGRDTAHPRRHSALGRRRVVA